MEKQMQPDVEGEAQVLVFYSRLMESVQRFEWSLKELAIGRDESTRQLGFDEAWKRALAAMRKPTGALVGEVRPELVAEIEELRGLRNKIAHEILLLWRVDTDLGLAEHGEVSEGMFETAMRFDACRAQVEELVTRHLRELGIERSDLEMDRGRLKAILEGSPTRAAADRGSTAPPE
jgi:hypothetical protein